MIALEKIMPNRYVNTEGTAMDIKYFKVRLENKYGLIAPPHTIVIPTQYDDIGYLSEGMVAVKLNGLWGFVSMMEGDNYGKEVIPTIYQNVTNFKNGLAKVRLNDKEGYIDKENKTVVPTIYDEIVSTY